eukprot:GSChrysophyteH2.ASY1.ANO1.838.1 assembled CDS
MVKSTTATTSSPTTSDSSTALGKCSSSSGGTTPAPAPRPSLKAALGLDGDFSVQLSCYEGTGTHYTRHKDAFPAEAAEKAAGKAAGAEKGGRLLTWLYYVNLQPKGGQLRKDIGEKDTGEQHTDIEALSGRAIAFRSDLVEHRCVMHVYNRRYALTFWAKGSLPAPTIVLRQIPPRLPLPLPLPLSSFCSSSSSDNKSKNSIFVSIAAYRDSELQHTVRDLYAQAVSPETVFVGIVWQGCKSDIDGGDSGTGGGGCFDRRWWLNNVRFLSMHASQAQGPCYARHVASSLWRGEQWQMQIDSHMRFRRGWDVYCVSLCLSLREQQVRLSLSLSVCLFLSLSLSLSLSPIPTCVYLHINLHI